MDNSDARQILVDCDQLSSVVVEHEDYFLEDIHSKDEYDNTYRLSWSLWLAISIFFLVPAIFWLISLTIQHHSNSHHNLALNTTPVTSTTTTPYPHLVTSAPHWGR